MTVLYGKLIPHGIATIPLCISMYYACSAPLNCGSPERTCDIPSTPLQGSPLSLKKP